MPAPGRAAIWGAAERPRCDHARAGYPDREAAQEAVHFHQEDEKLLKKLLQKVRQQAEQADPHRSAGVKAAELSALEEVVGDTLSAAQKEGECSGREGGGGLRCG